MQYFSDVSDDRATLVALSQNLEIDEQLLDRLSRQASQLPGRELLRLIELLGGAQTEIRGGLDPRLQLEMALVKAARPEVDHSPDALEERLRRLERAACPSPSRSAAEAGGRRRGRRARHGGGHTAARRAQGAPARSRPRPSRNAAPGTSPSRHRAAGPPAAAAHGRARRRASRGRSRCEAPEAAAAEAEPDGGAARVKRAWQLVLQQAEAQNVTLYAAIKDARVHADGETLVVALPSSLTYGRASSPANRELLEAIIVRTTGDTPELQYELADDQAAPSSAPRAAEPDAGLTIAERIALAKRELDASELPDDD